MTQGDNSWLNNQSWGINTAFCSQKGENILLISLTSAGWGVEGVYSFQTRLLSPAAKDGLPPTRPLQGWSRTYQTAKNSTVPNTLLP
jgi:hypothetical protein